MKNISINRIKLISIPFLVFTFILLSACGADSTNKTAETNNDSGSDSETYKLKMNVSFPPAVLDWEPKIKATEDFAKLVEEKTDGRVNIEIFYNNQLVGQGESLDALARGTIDMQVTTPTAWSEQIPESSFATLPFWNKGSEHTTYMLRETELGELYEQALEEYGVKQLFYWQSDETGFMSNKPIMEPADLEGLIVNNSSSITLKYFESMGAAAANIPFTELYEGLLRGTVDAIQYPFSALETYKFHEVVDYITVPGALKPSFGIVSINQSKWDEFPADIQDAITEASMEMEAEALEASMKLTEYSFEVAEENGVEIVEMTKEAEQQFIEYAQETAWEEFANISDRARKMIEVILEENNR